MESWTRFILLFLMISLSDAEEVKKKNLPGTKGGNITLPHPVLEKGFLRYGDVIALVIDRKFSIEQDIYNNRLHWNSNSGLFTLTDLQKNNSGIYSIDSKKGQVSTKSIYNLTVYDPVAPPAVRTLSVSSDSCYLLCAVDKAAEITLWWYKDQEVVNLTSSSGTLPLNVTKQDFNSSYRCVAGNPADNKTVPVDVKILCSQIDPNGSSDDNQRYHWIIIGVVATLVAVVTASAALICWKHVKTNEWTATERQEPEGTNPDVEYTEVNICSQGGNLPNSPGPVDRSNLTTVYDKLEVHRMVLADSDGNIS